MVNKSIKFYIKTCVYPICSIIQERMEDHAKDTDY